MESERLRKIKKENARFEQEAPYNFCDRWCQRCIAERQNRCRLYLDELEQKLTCIAYGKEPDDLEITTEVMRQQYEGVEEDLEKFIEENGIELDDLDEGAQEAIERQEEFMHNNPLHKTAGQYHNKAHKLLEETFYKKDRATILCHSEFEVVAWYHTLLLAKLYMALHGFHEPAVKGDVLLNDAVAQLNVCKKAINESVGALRTIGKNFTNYQQQITELIALLNNIHSRIELLEQGI
ncbi:MAG: hypothetical protein A2Y00_10475 [Omnitrophica WOR_2 bacterium GWF2_43_52]|nr:MAG: hypothetical protein A2Y00_10475 [Omnitrophica WOR_2 bacterium GWF2_43_52]OGX53802.1 MAG: hypothetical protein A2460_05945 [Omnitrophica WOR_2 bacterium RIFOXYC2_FULL_43_9]HAH20171.1 hypothetical protein [Candidatus Omnitrophota bacterium]HBG63049.1 hypothetical protein [Candidatus Omnitrophota bacterium]HCD37159.1 hypothetical protein [Candidatus Omnitrophota bacterium]